MNQLRLFKMFFFLGSEFISLYELSSDVYFHVSLKIIEKKKLFASEEKKKRRVVTKNLSVCSSLFTQNVTLTEKKKDNLSSNTFKNVYKILIAHTFFHRDLSFSQSRKCIFFFSSMKFDSGWSW